MYATAASCTPFSSSRPGNDVLGHPVAGPSWEGFVVENLIVAAGDRRTPYFYRTEDGAEVDLVFERGGSVEMAIEIKRTTAPAVSRGFRSGLDTLRPDHAYLVHGGEDTWPVDDKITAVSLIDLMDRLLAASRASPRRSAPRRRR